MSFLIPAVLAFLFISPQALEIPADSPARSSSMEGAVVKATTGEPLAKAYVVLTKLGPGNRGVGGPIPPMMYVAATDSGGRFTFNAVEPGQYRLWVQRQGYLGQGYSSKGRRQSNEILDLSPGQTLKGIEIRLTPYAAVSGQVFDQDGEPMQSSRIDVLQALWQEGHRRLGVAGGAMSDDRGQYRVFGLSPGKYYLCATYTMGGMLSQLGGQVIASGSVQEKSYVPTCYPGTTDVSSAVPLDLKAGDDVTGMDFTLLPVPAVRVRGRIVNLEAGAPPRFAYVRLVAAGSAFRGSMGERGASVQNDQGTFELHDVAPGSYDLVANWNDGKISYTARKPLEVGAADLDGVNVALVPNFDVTGRVTLEGSPQAEVKNVMVFLQPIDESYLGGLSSQVNPDGTFILRGAGEGVYKVTVGGACGDCFLKSLRWGGAESSDDTVALSHERASDLLELTLSSAAAHVDGTVLDDRGQPFKGAFVVLVPDSNRRGRSDLYKITSSGQNGEFSMAGIAPGEYELFAWPSAEDVAYQGSDWLAEYEKKGESIRLAQSDRKSVQLQVIPFDNSAQ